MMFCAPNYKLIDKYLTKDRAGNNLMREVACDTFLAFFTFMMVYGFAHDERPMDTLSSLLTSALMAGYGIDTFFYRFTNRAHGYNDNQHSNSAEVNGWGGACCIKDRDCITLTVNLAVSAALGIMLAVIDPDNTVTTAVFAAEMGFAVIFNGLRSWQNYHPVAEGAFQQRLLS